MDESASGDRSVLRGLLALERDRALASSLVASLQAGERRFVDLTEEERQSLEGAPLVELVMQTSFGFRYSDPGRMVALAKTAQVLADHLSVRRYGRKIVADFRARACAELGNAYRVGGEFDAAAAALRHAAACAKNGTGNPDRIAHILHRWAVLLRETGTLSEAAEILKLVISYFQRAGDRESLVGALIGLALVHEEESEPEQAVAVLLQALRLLIPDPGSPRLMLLSGMNSLAVNLAGAGEFSRAWAVLQKTKRLYRRSGKLNQYRFCWLEGKIAAGLGRTGLAEAKFNTARLAFRRINLNFMSALASLDLGLLYAKQKRHGELIWLVDDMVRTFRALKIAREVLASLILLRKSAEKRFSAESLCLLIESIAATVTELSGRAGSKAA
jgi:tetratricopeptide (TPR) repeat protein